MLGSRPQLNHASGRFTSSCELYRCVLHASRPYRHSRRVSVASSSQAAAADSSSLAHQAAEDSVGSSDRPSRYLTFNEYVALQKAAIQQQQQQQQQQQAVDGAASPPAQQPGDSSSDTEDGTKKRVPWNKGRKHSALTIARIVAGNARARERPDVRANTEAANQSRLGVPMPEEIREKIRQGGKEAHIRRLQNTTKEELEVRRAAISERSKRLWQDPEYIAKTTAAIRAAMAKRSSTPRGRSSTSSRGRGGSSSSSSSSTRPRRASRPKAVQSGSDQMRQQQPKQPKKAAPTKKALAAAAAKQRQQLQQQVDHLMQMRQLIANTERSVLQLQLNLQAFENNPQAHQAAANTMQQAETHLEALRTQVTVIEQLLQQRGVAWDPNSGSITYIAGLPEQTSSRSSKGSSSSIGTSKKAARHNSSGSGGGSSGDSDADIVRSSRRSKAPAKGGGSSSSGGGEAGGDIVRSARRQPAAGPASNSSDSAAARAAAEAASAGGSRHGSGSADVKWEVPGLPAHVNGQNGSTAAAAAAGVPVNGLNGKQHVNGVNGHSNSEGTMYITVKVQQDVLLDETQHSSSDDQGECT